MSDPVEALTRVLSAALARLGSTGHGPTDRPGVRAVSVVVSGAGLAPPRTGGVVLDAGDAESILRDELSGAPGPFDLAAEYGVGEELARALDPVARVALAAGLDALREAGIPLVETRDRVHAVADPGSRWLLPEAIRDDTGVVLAREFPADSRFVDALGRFRAMAGREQERATLREMRPLTLEAASLAAIDRRIGELDAVAAREAYAFDQGFLLRMLATSHGPLARSIGALGPGTQVNSAGAATAAGVACAEDWIRSGRCRRVIVLSVNDPVGEGHGPGACALVLESREAVEERGMRGLVELVPADARMGSPDGASLETDSSARDLQDFVKQHVVHLAAGFGSRLSFTLARRIPGGLDRMDSPAAHRRWLVEVSGLDPAEAVVERRILRVRSIGAPSRPESRAEETVPPIPEDLPSIEGPGFAAPSLVSPASLPASPGTPARLEDADRVPRRVPLPVLRPPIDLCASTRVTLGLETRVVVAFDQGGVGSVLTALLGARGVPVLELPAALETAALEARIDTWLSEGPIRGVFWLPALDAEPPLAHLDLAGFRELNRVRVKTLAAAMRRLYEAVRGPGTFLVSATRMGGFLGVGGLAATAPLGGAVAGFTKAYRHERPEALVKVVDHALDAPSYEIAAGLIEEALADHGCAEVGRRDGLRITVGLEERPAADGAPGMRLATDTVFLVTGAAGGITSEIVADLAAATGGTFYLVDLVPAPRKDHPQIALFRTNKEGLKRTLAAEAKTAGEKPTQAQIEQRVLAVEREEAALRAIEAVEEAGGRARYRSIDLLDGPAVAAVVKEIRERHRRIDVILHAGGVDVRRSLSEKESAEFDLVFDVTSDGFFNLLDASEGMPVGAVVAFSSVGGRFGSPGQTDSSAAGGLLGALTSSLKATRPGTRAIAVDWALWGRAGIARGAIHAPMEEAGMDAVPREAGIPTIRRELTAGGTSGEVVVAGRLGVLTEERDLAGGLDPGKAATALAARQRPFLLVGRVLGVSVQGGLEAETTLDPRVQPFLFDHVLNGTPLLPFGMVAEAFAELATLLCPGHRVAAVEDAQVLSPLEFHGGLPRTLVLAAVGVPAADGDVLVATTLKAGGHVHFRATVRMARGDRPRAVEVFTPPSHDTLLVGKRSIYSVFFQGPSYQVVERARVEAGTAMALMPHGLSDDTVPARAASLTAPRVLELCFQAAALWELSTRHVLALPKAFKAITLYRHPMEAEGRRLWALVTPNAAGTEYGARAVDDAGNVYLKLTGYRSTPLPGRAELPAS